MKTLIVHLGYPKCASSLLQQKVFAELGCNYLCGLDVPSIEVLKRDPQEFAEAIRRSKNYNDNIDLTIVSYPPFSSPTIQQYNQNHFDILCHNMNMLSDNVKVVLIVRNQISLIKSWYVYSVTRGMNTVTYHSFTKWLDRDFSVLDPKLLLSSCLKCFERDNILVLPMELLNQDREIFMAKLGEFLGKSIDVSKQKKVNKGYYNCYSINLWRMLNFLYLSAASLAQKAGVSTTRNSFWHNKIKRKYQRTKVVVNPIIERYLPGKIKLTLPEKKQIEFRELFGDGNRLASTCTDVPLEKFDYPM